ncbi:hypothetical protein KJ780_03830, partial [Candidatus Micrarchaeota archaeon]|nr:hypothetical protein [Candidatus Micrarchaeota archaeon]
IGIGVINNPELNSLAVSPNMIAEILLFIAFQRHLNDLYRKMLYETYDRAKGYPAAFSTALASLMKKGHENEVKEGVQRLFSEEKREEACGLIASIGENKISSEFKNELLHSAREGWDMEKANALAGLAPLVVVDSEIKDYFISVLDGWDDDARWFCAGVLSEVKDESAAKKAFELIQEEKDPEMLNQLLKILETNETFSIHLIEKRLNATKSKKEAKVILDILLKAGKTKKLKEMLAKIRNAVSEEIAALIDSVIK